MAAKNVFTRAALAAFLLVLPLSAQKVLLLGNGSTVSDFSGDPFQAATPAQISANVGVFAVLSNPTATRLFFISSNNVTVTDSNGASIQTPIALGVPIKAAAVTPDGARLLVAAGTASAGSLYVFDITLGTAAQTAVVTIGSNPSGVAASMDSTAALVVAGSGLSSVDLNANTVTATVALPGASAPGSGVVAGPNGLFYVNALNELYEIDPRTVTVLNAIAIRGFPSKPVFTPDGSQILLANPGATSTDEQVAMVVDVASHKIVDSVNFWGLQIGKLIWASGGRIFVVTGTQALAQYNSDLTGLQQADFGAGPIVGVIDAFTSTDVPTSGGWPGARYLYVVTPGALYRVDLNPPSGATMAQIQQSLPLSVPPISGVYILPVSSSTPAEVDKFGDNQVLALSAVSLPLVVRAADSVGRPVFGAGVSFNTTGGSFLGAPMASTNANGMAEAIIRAPTAGGSFIVEASVAGGANAWFNITVSAAPPSGPGPGQSGLQKLIGDGQVNDGGIEMYEPLSVILRDISGNPVSGAPVTFTFTGSGTMTAPSCTAASGGRVCTTDSNGVASIGFIPPDIFEREGSYLQSSVTAATTLADGTLQSVTFIESGVPSLAFNGNAGPLQGQLLRTPSLGGTVSVQAGQTAVGAIQLHIFAQSGPSEGGPMPNVGIHMSTINRYNPTAAYPPVQCNGGTALSNASGDVSCDLVAPLSATPGTYPLWLIVAGNTPLQINVAVSAAPPVVPVATIVAPVSGNNQTGSTGQALQPLVAVVEDQLGTPMAGISVVWTVVQGSAQLAAPTTTVTDANGRVSTGILLGSTPGPVVVRATTGTASAAVFNLTVVAAVGNIAKTSGDNQAVVIGQTFQPLTVLVTDTSGAVLPGIVVSFAVTAGVATPGSAAATTNQQGVASATFASTTTAGQITITASVGGKSVTFMLLARLPGPDPSTVVFLNGASFQPGVPIGGVVAIRGVGLTTGLTIPAGTCLSGTPDGNLQRGLPTQLAGMQIVFSTQVAPIFGICVNADGTEQVNVQAPFELAPATITVLIKTGIGTAEVDTYIPNVTVSATLPGIFETNVDANTRIALAQRPNGTIVSPANPAKAGETIRLYVTGIGWVLDSADKQVQSNQPGYPGQLPWNVTTSVTLNNAGVTGTTAEFAQNLIGVFVVSFQIPAQNANATVPIFVSATPLGQATVNSLVSHIPVSQ